MNEPMFDPTQFDTSNPDTWPRTVAQAVAVLQTTLPEDANKQELREAPENDLIHCHFGLGRYIRNTLGLWKGNEALIEDTECVDADDASMVIVRALWEALQNT